MAATIKEILRSAPITVHEGDSLALALQVMVWGNIRHLPIVSGDTLVGVLGERDVLRRYAEVGRQAAARETAGTVMSSPPLTIRPNDDVAAAIKLVTDRGIGCLPVVERGRLIGIVTRRDLLAQEINGVEEHGQERTTAEPRPAWARLLVDDVMSRDPLMAMAGDTIRVVIERMGRHGIRHLPVVDVDRRVIGMLSDRDVRTAVGNPLHAVDSPEVDERIRSTRVSDAMTRAPLTLAAGTRLSRAASLFADFKVGAVPIVDDRGGLVGLLSYTDVLRAVVGPKPSVS
jgi:acetoin utilization protein AcuB